MSEWMDVWMNECVDEWMHGKIDKAMRGWMRVLTADCMKGCMDVMM